MISLCENLLNPPFSHIYIEKDIIDHPNTIKILSHFPKSRQVLINHYKDIFNRSRQNYLLQKQSQNLILAKKRPPFVYEGSPLCQNFGNPNFYYANTAINCVFDCEYCYLQGMYPSANIVVFVNLEDIFDDVKKLLKKHPVYLCISYDTDLLALEKFLGLSEKWFEFSGLHPQLTVELRTKSANWNNLEKLTPQENTILAWTLPCGRVWEKYEHGTPSPMQRLNCIEKAMAKGYQIRLCFDPIIYIKDWEEQYGELIETVFSKLPAGKIKDVSIGSFRIPCGYLKNMRKIKPYSSIINYPFRAINDAYTYPPDLSDKMNSYMQGLLKKYIPEEKIFLWNN
ncbi:MAG TPA: radical SAM protein [Clostridia bacterium]